MGYWPLMPLLDRMLADRRARPALVLQSRPTGPARSLRIAARGGWLGAPGPAARRRARRRAETAAAAAAVARLEVGGFELGGWFHRRAVEIVRRRAERGIADAAMLRRAFGSGRVRRVVVPFDHTPVGRLLVTLAHEASIPTLVVQHGAYFLPSELTDMQVGREVAVWSPALVPAPILARDPHVVGYPLGHARPATRARGPAGPARVLVLPQPYDPTTCVVDSRIVMRHYSAAIEAARATLGDARVALRPHPADDLEAVAELQRRYGDLEVDRRPDILQVLRDADLCIAGCSTATLQAALVGTPVIVLNATGYEWRRPLGADTAVPIARGFEDLSRWLERWAGGAVLPGGKDLLDALGVDGGDAAGRLLGIVDVRGSTARRENTPLTTVSRTEP